MVIGNAANTVLKNYCFKFRVHTPKLCGGDAGLKGADRKPVVLRLRRRKAACLLEIAVRYKQRLLLVIDQG